MEYMVFALCVPGIPIDAALTNHVLKAITESHLDISLAVNELEHSAREIEHHWQLRLFASPL